VLRASVRLSPIARRVSTNLALFVCGILTGIFVSGRSDIGKRERNDRGGGMSTGWTVCVAWVSD
jgi:hypothetical protein